MEQVLLRNYFLIALMLITGLGKAQVNEISWVKSIASNYTEECISTTIDDFGNIYNVGFYSNRIDVDPSANDSIFKSMGGYDIYVVKLDKDGEFIWGNSFGGVSYDVPSSISVNGNSEVLIGGYFRDTLYYNSGGSVKRIISKGRNDGFVINLTQDGDVNWAKSFGGKSDDYISSVALNETGIAYASGSFKDTILVQTVSGLVEHVANGAKDGALFKISSNSDVEWINICSSASTDLTEKITLNSIGGVYAVSMYGGELNIHLQNSDTVINNLGDYDVLLQNINSFGEVLWVKSLNSKGTVSCKSIVLDNDENLYLAGYFTDSIQFTKDILGDHYESADFYYVKISNDGDYLNHQTFGGLGNDFVNSIAVDNDFNIYLVGEFANDLEFPNYPSQKLVSSGERSGFVMELNYEGELLFANKQAGGFADECETVNVFNGEVIVSGTHRFTTNFSIMESTVSVKSQGVSDVFLMKLVFNPVLGLNNSNYDAGILCFPNPVVEELTLTSSSVIDFISLKDSFGNNLLIHPRIENNDYKLELSNFPLGVYFLEVNSNGNREVLKILKQ